jgi:hypothetical protein
MPVAGQHALVDGPADQRKAHVGTAVVDGVDLSLVVEQRDRATVVLDHRPALLGEIGAVADGDVVLGGHGRGSGGYMLTVAGW